MYWWIVLWLLLGIVAYIGVLNLVYKELYGEQSAE